MIADLGGPPSFLLPAPPSPLSSLPLVCNFTELDRSNNGDLPSIPISSSEEAPSSSHSPWIDGIIRDLISSSSADISIPQLIQNVKEVVLPCNPNLAAALEFRLRSLSSSSASALPDHPPQQLPPQPIAEPTEKKKSQPQTQNQKISPQTAEETAAAATVATREGKEELKKQKRDEEGLHLLILLLQCAESVSADNLEEANRALLEISELSTPFGTSAQRIAAYFSEAMSARLFSACLGIYAPLPSAVVHRQKLAAAYQVFNGVSPFVKFSHFTANQAIQEAFEREERVHIIDLDIMQGLQWPGLFHILASRPGGPPHVRLTGLGTSMDALEATGKRLTDFAETLGLLFEFCPVAEKAGNVDPENLHLSKREAVAVNWLQHSLYDVTGSDANTLWLLQR